ncbi:MAG: hypothetical protein KGS72_26800 [Cyanobacteria bacterium REEB67]|nr:hypothetical protein [Cyanobacteria bacterium REEB67]
MTALGRLKNKISSLLKDGGAGGDGSVNHTNGNGAYGASGAHASADIISEVVRQQFATLDKSRIKIDMSRQDIIANGKVPDAPFASFLSSYGDLRRESAEGASVEAQEKLTRLHKGHPFMCDFGEMAIKYMDACDGLPESISPLLRRHFYRFISIFNDDNAAAHIFDYKKDLPRIGLLYFPNPGPKNFVVDALSGMADIHDMEPGKLVELAWSVNGYNFDYAAYQQALKQRTEAEIDALPKGFVGRFPSRDWLVKELSAAVQYQWALVELLKRKYWDVIFLGAAETPLAQALYDVPQELLPPIVSLCHGIPSGDPLMNFFNRIDKVVVRCEPEKEFYADLGVAPEQMTFVGSTSIEDFPRQIALQHMRSTARSALGLDESDTVIVYATTYDISIYNTKSRQEILDLMLGTFKLAASEHNLKNPVLYIKYHPSPASDPHYSFSRNQYPFAAFGALSAAGYRVRLTDSIEAVLPACDCFIAHESSTLTEALDFGVPTISIKMHNGEATPLLGKRAYAETTCHKHFSVYDQAATIATHLATLCNLEKTDVFTQSRNLWRAIFATGRSAGLMKTAELVESLIAVKKG